MSTEKRVFNKLFNPKTNLSKKVNLESINELKKLESDFYDLIPSATRDIRFKGVELRKMARTAIEESDRFENEIKQALNLFEQKAVELGVNPSDISEYVDLLFTLQETLPNYRDIFKVAMDLTGQIE